MGIFTRNMQGVLRKLKTHDICRIVVVVIIICDFVILPAQERYDTLHVYFKQGFSRIDSLYLDNADKLSLLLTKHLRYIRDSHYLLKNVYVVSAASPEGNRRWNDNLSQRRADALLAYMNRTFLIEPDKWKVTSLGVDWQGLIELVSRSEVPYREEVLEVLNRTEEHNRRLSDLQSLRNGEPYRWMYRHLFPYLRYSLVVFEVEEGPKV